MYVFGILLQSIKGTAPLAGGVGPGMLSPAGLVLAWTRVQVQTRQGYRIELAAARQLHGMEPNFVPGCPYYTTRPATGGAGYRHKYNPKRIIATNRPIARPNGWLNSAQI